MPMGAKNAAMEWARIIRAAFKDFLGFQAFGYLYRMRSSTMPKSLVRHLVLQQQADDSWPRTQGP